MTAFATLAAARDFAPVLVIRIEGIGDYSGQWAFCSKVPGYAGGSSLYKALLRRDSWPSHLPEDINPLGGVAGAGQLSFDLVDGTGVEGDASYDVLTARLRNDAAADLTLGSTLGTATSTGIVLNGLASKVAAIVDGETVLFMGGEAVRVVAITASSATSKTVDIERAQLDTEARPHDDGDSVFFYSPYVLGRRVRLFLGFDTDDFDGVEEELGQGWYVDRYGLGDDLGSWTFEAISRMKYLDRQLMRQRLAGAIDAAIGHDQSRLRIGFREPITQAMVTASPHFGDTTWWKHGDEVFGIDAGAIGNTGFVVAQARRGAGGTLPEAFEIGTDCRQVLLADASSGLGSFRFQPPGAETSSDLTGWQVTDHPVPIMLALLTSSAGAGDGLYLDNWEAGSGHYAALPPGMGLGLPMAEIDWASFLEVWYRTPSWRLPNLLVDEVETGREFLEREILRPAGIALFVRGGKLTCAQLRVPLATATGVAIGAGDVLLEDEAAGAKRWKLGASKSTEIVASSVTFKLRTRDAREASVTFTDDDFPTVFGNTAGYYRLDQGSIEIEVPGAEADGAGSHALLEARALRLLWRFRRPIWEYRLWLDLAFVSLVDVTDAALLTHPVPPDDTTGLRGITDRVCYVTSKTIVIDAGDAHVELVMVSFQNAGRFAAVAPAAIIESVVGDIATCAANRFTDPDAPPGLELPATDVGAFRVGDAVRLRKLDGTVVASTPDYQTVLSIDEVTGELELDGDFGGQLAADRIIVYTAWDKQTADQQELVSYAESPGMLGVGNDPAFTYGEP